MISKHCSIKVKDWDPLFQKFSIFSPIVTSAQQFAHYSKWPSINDYNEITRTNRQSIQKQYNKSIYFIEQEIKKSSSFELQYEPMIYLKGKIQTRLYNWHDYLNLLVWLTFPLTKLKLNERQYFQQKANLSAGIRERTFLENTLAQFDESGIIIASNEALADSLRLHQWQEVFYLNKNLFSDMQFFVFGHGLYEQALDPFIGLTGKGIILSVASSFMKADLITQLRLLDTQLSESIESMPKQKRARENLTPIPILGIPGWHRGPQDSSFYNNKRYFRERQNVTAKK